MKKYFVLLLVFIYSCQNTSEKSSNGNQDQAQKESGISQEERAALVKIISDSILATQQKQRQNQEEKDKARKIAETNNKPKGFAGYWVTDGKTYSRAIHIIKNGNLYNVEQIISDWRTITTNNITISGNRLDTRYGYYEYVDGNDILLDRSVSNGTFFKRMTKDQWENFQSYE